MKKVLGTCLMAFIIAILIIPNFAHADSFEFTIESDKSEIKKGETVTLSLKIRNIDAGELGIDTVEGKLSYDKSVFEEVSKTNFTEANGWSIKYNDEETEENGKFLGILMEVGTKSNQEIGQIKLKAKENLNVSETTIKVTDIATNNGKNLIKDSDKEITLKIAKESSNGEQTNPDNNGNGNNTGNNNNGVNNNDRNNNNNSGIITNINNYSNNSNNNPQNPIISKINETNKKIDLSKLPETGTGRMIIYIIVILLLVIINLFIQRKDKKKKKHISRIIK